MKRISLVIIGLILMLSTVINAQTYTVEENKFTEHVFSNISKFETCVDDCIDNHNIVDTYGNYNCVDSCIGDRCCSECMDDCYYKYNPIHLLIDKSFDKINMRRQNCFINTIF